MRKKTTVWLVDDHPLFISGLKALLDSHPGYTVILQVGSAEDLLTNASITNAPDLALIDIHLPGISGIDLCRKLKTDFGNVKVIALTSHDDPRMIRQMIQAGANGYLLKTVDEKELFSCLETVLANKEYIQAELRESLIQFSLGKPPKEKSGIPKLTPREKDILALIIKGYTTSAIAEKLFVTPATVETHRMNLFQKLDVKNVAALVREAIQNNLLGQ